MVSRAMHHSDTARPTDIAVLGAGPAGLMAAAQLARLGLTVTLIGERSRAAAVADARTAALFPQSMAALADVGVADVLAPIAARLGAIRLIDGMGGLLRAPEVVFRAEEIGLERLATNVPLDPLAAALAAVVAARADVIWHRVPARRVELAADHAALVLDDGRRIASSLIVAADGRDSIARSAAGIEATMTSLDQTAIVAAFDHTSAHHDVSTEIHRPGGPCTTVPLPPPAHGGYRSSLVWLERTAIATRLLSLDDAAFSAALSRLVAGHCGRITAISPRAGQPMRRLSVDTFGRRRVALVGETAHVFPPLGAQGLNLTIRDIGSLASTLADARRQGRDLGSEATLEAYSRARRADVGARVVGVGLINASLLADLPAAGLARGAALHVLAALPALKRQVMRAGMSAPG